MILGKYNQAKTVTFDLVAPDGIDLIINATFASGDVVIMKDEGAEANTSNLPTDEGTGYSLVLTATEMSAARIRVYIIDQTGTKIWLDTSLGLETYGNTSAEHAFDLDTASTAQTGDSYTRIGAPAGASISVDLADVPTVAEFNARTLVAASYFDYTADNVTVGTNNDKSGYSLTQAFPPNFANTVISVGGRVDSLVQGYLNTSLTETTAGRIAGNFDTFFENADAATTKTVDAVGGGSADWTTTERNEIRGRLGITGTTAAGGNTPTLSLQATIDLVKTETDKIQTVLVDTNDLQTNQGNWLTAAGFATETKQDAQDLIITETRLAELDAGNLPATTDSILVDTNELQVDWTNGGRLDLLLDRLITEIDTARAEPAQGAPAASTKIGDKIDYLYKAWRNKTTQTATALNIYDDAGTTIDHKSSVSDDSTTATRGEIITGA